MITADQKLTDKLVARMGGEAEDTSVKKAFDLAERFWLARPYKSDEFAAEVIERFTTHAELWRDGSSGMQSAIMESYRTYHGLNDDEYSTEPTVDLVEGGEQGEFMRLFVNQYRGLMRHQIALLTADRLIWDPQARTSGAAAAKQVSLARCLADWLVDAKGYEKRGCDAAETMHAVASSFIAQGWNPNGGHKGRGDIWATVLAPWECAHEDVREYTDCQWWIFVRWESRWDWVAHFAKENPDLAERLASHDFGDDLTCGVRRSNDADQDADRIPLLYVYANPSRACPLGRVAIVAGAEGELVLQDGPSPYGEAPIKRMCSAEFIGTSRPIGNSWSMLPMQKAFDVVNSAMMSRVDMFAIPNVASQDGVEFEAGDISGANSLKYPPGASAPVVVDLLTIPSPLPSMGETLTLQMEQASGINSVTRGNPTENITSGSMAALIAAQAKQFNSSDERAYIKTMEDVATDAIRIYQKCATEAQLIAIVGQDERYTTREFRGEDLSLVQRISIKVGNALSRSVAGRIEIANALLDRNMIQDPREYLEVLNTGNLSPVFRGPVHEVEMIKSENEMMTRGEDPLVSPWDNDELHIREHRCELDTGARYEPETSARINKHLMAHMQSWQQKTLSAPDMLAAIGQNPLPAAQAAQQAAQQMESGSSAPLQPGSPPQKTPNAAPPQKQQPGPKPQPKGAEQSQAAPSLPQQAQEPRSPEL